MKRNILFLPTLCDLFFSVKGTKNLSKLGLINVIPNNNSINKIIHNNHRNKVTIWIGTSEETFMMQFSTLLVYRSINSIQGLKIIIVIINKNVKLLWKD